MWPANGKTVDGYRSLLTLIVFFPASSVPGGPMKNRSLLPGSRYPRKVQVKKIFFFPY